MNSPSVDKLAIISGPSGAGKSTVVRQLMRICPLPMKLSISATTRNPRSGETDGVEYYFMSHEEFSRRRANAEFLECKEVFGRGDWYGTLSQEVSSGNAAGKCVILEIDVEGCLSVLQQYPDAVTIFLHPGSMDELERRLRARGTDSEESIARRLQVARREMASLNLYRYQVVNEKVDQAVRDICKILTPSGE